MAKTKTRISAEELERENSTALETLRRRRAEDIRVLHDNPRELYVADRKFVVIREGARFEGILEHGKFWSGWSRKLELGEIITCEGWKRGLETEQEGVNWTAKRVPDNLLWCQVWPVNGLFTPWPLPGYLKALPDNF